MRNQRFENKRSQKNHFQEADQQHGKKHRSADGKDSKNWKNKLFTDADEEDADDDFFQYDEDED